MEIHVVLDFLSIIKINITKNPSAHCHYIKMVRNSIRFKKKRMIKKSCTFPDCSFNKKVVYKIK